MKNANKYRDFFDTDRLRDNLKKRSLRGGLFTIVGSGVNFVIRFGSSIVLARILLPEHFGLIGMVTALTAIAENFKDFGLSVATIQQKEITHEQVSTLFWINAALGVAIMSVVGGSSFLIAWFYQDPRLLWITLALATSFFWSGITVQHQAILSRRMKFGILTSLNTGVTILSTAIGIVLAIEGYGAWALVWKEVSRSCLSAIGTWLTCPWLPGLPSRNARVGGMVKMGGDLTAFNIITFFTENLDYVLMGKYFGASALGLYKQGTQLAMLPIGILTEPLQTVGQPALRLLLDDARRYREYYRKIVESLTFINMPMMVFLYIYARDIILMVFGEKWIGAVVFFKIFAAAGFIRPAISTSGLIMISCGKSRRYLVIGVANSLFIILGILLGFYYGGSVGIAAGHVIVNYVLFVPIAYIAFRETPITVGLFLSSISPSLISSLIMGFALTLFSTLNTIQNSYYSIAVSFVVASAVYLVSWMLMPHGKVKLTGMVSDFVSMVRPSRTTV